MATEREEYDEQIARYKAAITEELVTKMGVKQDAAIRAVAAQTRFGLVPNHVLGGESVHINVGGKVRKAYGGEREIANWIRATLPEEAFTAYDEPSPDEKSWAAYEERLAATSREFSREELREQKKQEELERILNPEPKGPPTADELRIKTEISSFI